MNLDQIQSSYNQTIDIGQGRVNNLKKTIFKVGSARLLIVLLGIFVSYYTWGNTPVVISSIILSTLLFISLMKYHNILFYKKLYAEVKIQNAINELKGLNYDFSAFDGAIDKIDPNHSYSLDLDLFGNRSFFQSLNRSVTSFGKDLLANNLTHPFEDKKDILLQQEAIKELANKAALLSHFRTIGKMTEIDNFNISEFEKIGKRPFVFYKKIYWRILLYAIPLSFILLSILYAIDIVEGIAFIPLWLITALISNIPTKKILAISNSIERKTAQLDTYVQLFKIVENESFNSELLKVIQSQIGKSDNGASRAIALLKSYQDNLTMSISFPVLMFFNPVLLWNVRYASKIEQWIRLYQEHINDWFQALGKFDALTSLAIFAYNHPDYTYPEISETVVFEAKSIAHPLLHRSTCVANDVKISKRPYFLVVTGANMAGKSTYLRTIGINHILACVGSPVCAASLVFHPNKLVTNLRTSDSLADNESYFFAELKRLKMIIDRLQSGEELFIILDEILKGTNSEDKQKGSLALMKQLVSLDGNGIIATHDLVLGSLEKEYSNDIKNYCFEADIVNNHLSFSYKIREGIAKNMNACFLMKQMGITGL